MASSTTDLRQQQHVESALQPQGDVKEQEEHLISSPPGLWLPATVVKKNRRIAICIWLILLSIFFAYVYYIVSDGLEQRHDPAASIEVKEEVFKLPDVAICTSTNFGCYYPATNCFDVSAMLWNVVNGFEESSSNYTDYEDNAEVLAIQEEYPNCLVLPTSKLEPNRSGIDSGDVDHLGVRILALWVDDPFQVAEDAHYFSQTIGLRFVDISAGVEAFNSDKVDAYLPYSRVDITSDTPFTTTENHLVLSLTKFTRISKDGKKEETQNTFIQRTTSVDSIFKIETLELDDVAILIFTIWVNKFEFSNIEEVDPVDAWTIIGAIGGVWQFVVVGFGLFFVFAEKQAPEFKLRNFIKTATKPITSARRWSKISARTSSTQDTIVEAADEDLPAGWVKRRRSNGSMYYHNTITGMVQDDPVRGFPLDLPAPSAGSRPAYQGEAFRDSLPAGWVERTDDNGRKYYMNTRGKYTQWKRPSQRAAILPGGRGTVVEVDAPRMTCRHSSGTSTNNVIRNAVPRTNPLWPRVPSGVRNVSRVEGDIPTAGDAELPANWHKRETPDGKTYYANRATKKTQWERPTR